MFGSLVFEVCSLRGDVWKVSGDRLKGDCEIREARDCLEIE